MPYSAAQLKAKKKWEQSQKGKEAFARYRKAKLAQLQVQKTTKEELVSLELGSTNQALLTLIESYKAKKNTPLRGDEEK